MSGKVPLTVTAVVHLVVRVICAKVTVLRTAAAIEAKNAVPPEEVKAYVEFLVRPMEEAGGTT